MRELPARVLRRGSRRRGLQRVPRRQVRHRHGPDGALELHRLPGGPFLESNGGQRHRVCPGHRHVRGLPRGRVLERNPSGELDPVHAVRRGHLCERGGEHELRGVRSGTVRSGHGEPPLHELLRGHLRHRDGGGELHELPPLRWRSVLDHDGGRGINHVRTVRHRNLLLDLDGADVLHGLRPGNLHHVLRVSELHGVPGRLLPKHCRQHGLHAMCSGAVHEQHEQRPVRGLRCGPIRGVCDWRGNTTV